MDSDFVEAEGAPGGPVESEDRGLLEVPEVSIQDGAVIEIQRREDEEGLVTPERIGQMPEAEHGDGGEEGESERPVDACLLRHRGGSSPTSA